MKKISESALSVTEKETLDEVKRTIHAFLPTATVLLYGSVARGTQRPDSDYDVLVLTDEPVARAQQDVIDDAVYDIQLAHGVLIVVNFMDGAFWEHHPAMPLRQEVDRDAILL
jgi:predicted nucleotidyltransferase